MKGHGCLQLIDVLLPEPWTSVAEIFFRGESRSLEQVRYDLWLLQLRPKAQVPDFRCPQPETFRKDPKPKHLNPETPDIALLRE